LQEKIGSAGTLQEKIGFVGTLQEKIGLFLVQGKIGVLFLVRKFCKKCACGTFAL